jgi:hypothetical protein
MGSPQDRYATARGAGGDAVAPGDGAACRPPAQTRPTPRCSCLCTGRREPNGSNNLRRTNTLGSGVWGRKGGHCQWSTDSWRRRLPRLRPLDITASTFTRGPCARSRTSRLPEGNTRTSKRPRSAQSRIVLADRRKKRPASADVAHAPVSGVEGGGAVRLRPLPAFASHPHEHGGAVASTRFLPRSPTMCHQTPSNRSRTKPIIASVSRLGGPRARLPILTEDRAFFAATPRKK